MTVARIALALVFVAAVVGKGRYFMQFVDYLRPILGHRSKLLAIGALVLEAAIAPTIVLAETAPVASIVAIAFLVIATSLVAFRLSVDSQTACACWGAAKPPQYGDLGYADMLRPAWYGLRNGALCFVLWLVTRKDPNIAVGLALVCGCVAVMLAGLAASIVHERAKLSLAEHPRRDDFAPYLAPLIALSWYSGPGL